MTIFVWPNGVRKNSCDWRLISNCEAFPAAYGGVQTVERPGDRHACVINLRNLFGAERSKVLALIAALRGSANRIYLADPSYRKRGSFPSSELLANSDFATNDVTGWTTDAGYSAAVSDQVARCERSTIGATASALSQTVTVTQYAPYAIRALALPGRGTFASLVAGLSGINNTTLTPGSGLAAAAGISSTTGMTAFVFDASTSGNLAGDHFFVPYLSLQRCALVDAAPNLLLQSNTFANASWTKNNVTATDNAINGPDFLGNMAKLTETAVNSTHEVVQNITVTSGAQEIFLGCVVINLLRSWARLRLIENTSATVASAYFNLVTGATGTTATGANWSNLRTGSVNLGGGYFYCWIIARKTNAATSVASCIGAATADNVGSYLGVAATDAIGVWHAVSAPSSQPIRYNGTPTTSTAASSGTPSSSANLYLKGLPASTSGLALRADRIQVDKQLKSATADLKSDAAGLGMIVLDSPFARTLADNTPVFFGDPMAKFRLVNDVEYPNVPGGLSDFTLQFEQDLSA
jgi:hypothetical protein